MVTDELLETISFDSSGLVPAIAQQHNTGEILMMAWMNAESIGKTLETGRVFGRTQDSLCGERERLRDKSNH